MRNISNGGTRGANRQEELCLHLFFVFFFPQTKNAKNFHYSSFRNEIPHLFADLPA